MDMSNPLFLNFSACRKNSIFMNFLWPSLANKHAEIYARNSAVEPVIKHGEIMSYNGTLCDPKSKCVGTMDNNISVSIIINDYLYEYERSYPEVNTWNERLLKSETVSI